MTTSKMPDERIKTVVFEDRALVIGLMDGRRISTPLAWYPRLASATSAQLGDWEIVGAGDALHWAQFDEDLSVSAMLRGFSSAAPSSPEADTY
ncbi:DUF2442 domain-containing protein [Burkholderia sp. LMU1-1-1.1]|uniref:DUF2442 domain-containing protein n=1 Tax=Burkholderia sp. LMU1-1-1.1 TaxID=3135266 RepID=UPI00343FF8E4